MGIRIGDIVKYLGNEDGKYGFGNCTNPRYLLVVGQEYEIKKIKARISLIKFSLVGVDGEFNSKLFEKVK